MQNLSIALGQSRQAKQWSNKTITFKDLCKRLKTPVITPETVDEYAKMKKADRDAIKDKGGFVGGHLEKGRRTIESVTKRSMLTLDGDKVPKGFIDDYKDLAEYTSVLYTTHSHVPDAPRVRIIVPLTRDVSPDEYVAIARYFANEWGIDYFDKCSFMVNQLMYFPTVSSNGEYRCEVVDAIELDPDDFLSRYPNWKDFTQLPTGKDESVAADPNKKKLASPLEKDGIVGAFCRTYSISRAIDEFLSDIYAPTTMPDRYDFIEADSSAGVRVYDDEFFYSHHASDPASGRTLNAFDLVRIHKFPNADEKKSFSDMSAFASSLDDVKMQLASDRLASAQEDFLYVGDDWQKFLTFNSKTGDINNTSQNILLILNNDPDFNGFAYNELARKVEVIGTMPWDRPKDNKFWRDADTSQLIIYIDKKYAVFSQRNFDAAFVKTADDRKFHPIRDYLNGLPEWDGVDRVETLLIDFLGAEDTEYVRTVTRKTLCAAVARILRPGIKADFVTILNGPQGTGKSTLFAKLAGEWFSDSLNLNDMKDKSSAEKLSNTWIMELGELQGMRKADIEAVKSFISRTDDEYRPAYGRVVESHPRQCIIVGTTNSESGYLRDITGNRRFLPIAVKGGSSRHTWELTQNEIDMIWAEAKKIWEEGETLFLEGDVAIEAVIQQRQAMESDERQGMVEEYLDVLLPNTWDTMEPYERKNYISESGSMMTAKGVNQRTMVSNAEIWVECFGKSLSEMKPTDSYTIAALMTKVDGWERTEKVRKLPFYGRQRIYVRV